MLNDEHFYANSPGPFHFPEQVDLYDSSFLHIDTVVIIIIIKYSNTSVSGYPDFKARKTVIRISSSTSRFDLIKIYSQINKYKVFGKNKRFDNKNSLKPKLPIMKY